MSNSTTQLDTIASNQAAKEVTANALFDATSPAMIWGRHASACSGLTWGYYGGQYGANAIANGTVTLTASATNTVYADNTTGAVSVNTTGVPTGKIPLYTIVTGTTTVTSYTDLRSYAPQAVAGGGGSGTVTSVSLTLPTFLSVAGSPVTTSGTFTVTLAAQAANAVFAGPTSGSAAAPTFRALVGADIPAFIASGGSHAPGGVPDPGATAGATKFLREDSTWQVPAGGGGSSTLAALTDVNVTPGSGINGFSLTYDNASSKWIATNVTGGGGSFAALSDVSFSSLANNQVPVYNSTAAKWGNQTVSLKPLSATDTWNPADCSVKGALSAGNLAFTLTNTVTASFSICRGTVSKASGKWYFEFSSTDASTFTGGGIATSADAVDGGNSPGKDDSTGAILKGSGNVSYGTAQHNGVGPVTVANQAVMVAVDIAGGLIWFRTGNGLWNLSGTANPATGVGGYPITASLTYFPCLICFQTAATVSLNVGASAFSNTPPTSGFSAWNSADGAPGVQPSDVAVSVPTNGQVLTYNSTSGKWQNAAIPAMVASGASHASGIVPDPGATAGSTKFLREDATWAVPAGGGGSGPNVTAQSSAYNAAANDFICADTSGGSFSINLPASPTAGQQVWVADSTGSWPVNPIRVFPNGNNIHRMAQIQYFYKSGTLSFTYENATIGWVCGGQDVAPVFDEGQAALQIYPGLGTYLNGRGFRQTWNNMGNCSAISPSARSRGSGKLYFEFTFSLINTQNPAIGVSPPATALTILPGGLSTSFGVIPHPGSNQAQINSSAGFLVQAAAGVFYVNGDICGFAIDFAGTITAYKNNTQIMQATGLTIGTVSISAGATANSAATQGFFSTRVGHCTYSPPAGYAYWDN